MPRITELVELIRAGIPANAMACGDGYARIRHESFILRNFFIGVLSMAMVPVYLAIGVQSDLTGVMALGFLSLLAPVALLLSKSGKLVLAHILQAGVIATFVTWVIFVSGGIVLPAVLWLAILPFEAAVTGNRRLVLANIGIACFVFAGIGLTLEFGVIEPAAVAVVPGDALNVIFTAALILYGILLVLELDGLNRETLRVVRDREYLYRVVGDNVSNAVSLHDQSGETLFVTPSINEILSIDDGETLGDGLFSRVHVADRPAYLKGLSDALADMTPTKVEFRARAGSTEIGAGKTQYPEFVWLEMRCKPLAPVAGRPDRVVSVIRDVTERKQYEDDLRLAREKAEEAYALKTRFLANVSHELRTPLNAIIGFSDLVKSEVYGPIANDKYLEYIHLIHDSGAHLLAVVNDILDMSKIEAGKFQVIPEPFEAACVISECIAMTMPQAQDAAVNVVSRIPERIEDLTADRRAIRQILLNLLSNAIKFTEPGGTITVSARKTRDRFVLSVADTGIGISPEDMLNLGKPFFQADNSYSRHKEGTGLGLSVVKGLTELHGGEVRVKSTVGVGTTIGIDLPLPYRSSAVALIERAVSDTKPGPEDCAVVDDFDGARKMTA